jgi:pyridoxal phosphate enzyme (YggS family)
MTILDNYLRIKSEVEIYKDKKIIVVSKGQSIEKIKPLLESGHIDFGENRVQEAMTKWEDLRTQFSNSKLHLIGALQTNKAKEALSLFDYIHSLDNERLAKILSDLEDINQKKIKYFIQVNLGQETQKRGISDEHLKDFIDYCHSDLKLNIIGLMCIQPDNQDPSFYFEKLSILNKKFSLPELSMGMSSDYLIALKYNATYLRIGRSIFS